MYDYKKEHEKDMIGWIVATKDSKTKEYYREHYCDDVEFTDSLGGQIIANFLLDFDYKEALADAMRYLSLDLTMRWMEKGTDKFTFYETLWHAWKSWCFHLTRTKLTEMFGNRWEEIFKQIRSECNDEENKTSL